MQKHMKHIMLAIFVVLVLLIIVFFFVDKTGVTTLVTGNVVAPIIPTAHPLFDEDKVIMRVSNPGCASGCQVDQWVSTTFSNVTAVGPPTRSLTLSPFLSPKYSASL